MYVYTNTPSQALKKGYRAVKDAHVAEHSEKFARTGLRVQSTNPNATSAACAATLTTPERVERYGRLCMQPSLTAGTKNATVAVKDVGLQALFFDLGKYLLLGSSRTGSQPANLVGIWAEGRESPWNGDYHMNINLQMMYWSNEVLQLSETAEPLTPFVRELARSGASTAGCMYGKPGWVSHGFTDIWMKTRVLGDPQWAMCVTCGAWVALHLYEGVCIHVWICKYVYIYIHMYICVHMNMYTYTYICIYIYIHIYIYIYICMYICIYMCVYYAHIFMHVFKQRFQI